MTMIRTAAVLCLALQALWAAPKVYPKRWVYVVRSLRTDRDLDEIRQIARTAQAHGLNGLVLSGGLDRLEKQPPDYLERVRKVKAICAEHNLELIPQIFSAGYGSATLAFDKNLAEGIAVTGAVFAVRNGAARLQPDPAAAVSNGGMEEYQANRPKGFQLVEQPGEIAFVDTKVAHGGKVSVRLENFGANSHGHGRLMQEIAVRPRRQYRFTCWLKTEGLVPAGKFAIQVLSKEGRTMAPVQFDVPETGDWRQMTLGFNSLDVDRVRIYAGVWGGQGGRFWLDDWKVEEVGLVNVLRRPGTPLTVRDAAGATVYAEGRDYAPVEDPQLNFRFDHDGPPIRLLPGSRIRDGQALQVDYYHGIAINRGQVTVCMSEPKVYQIWREQVRRLHDQLGAGTYLLSMDEIRAGGSCAACKQRKLTMGQILGDCLTQQFNMLRERNPKAGVWVWSDMLDPNHNARGNYYLVDGDYTGSWEHIPKDMRIMCWYFQKRKESLEFFSRLGFVTMAGAYYDGDTLDNPQGWLEALEPTPKAEGIMYTTWRNKYDLLAAFGDLVSGK